jgi:hypothetical protein
MLLSGDWPLPKFLSFNKVSTVDFNLPITANRESLLFTIGVVLLIIGTTGLLTVTPYVSTIAPGAEFSSSSL